MDRAGGYRYFGAFRFLLALLVMLQHFFANLAPEGIALAMQPYEIGTIAVYVFFAVSGFVIFEAAEKIYSGRAGAFMINRLLRIVPQFVLSTGVLIAICYFFNEIGILRFGREEHGLSESAFSGMNIFANILSFLPVKSLMSYQFLTISWTLRVEFVFYVVVCGMLWASSAPVVARIFRGSLSRAGLAAAICFTPLFFLAVADKAPEMFRFSPYFCFGAAFYATVTHGGRIALATLVLSIVGMVLQFLAVPSLHPVAGFERAVGAQFLLLAVLLATMCWLATAQFVRGRRFDRRIGDVTYPLYLWHIAVMIATLSLTQGYSWVAFLIAIVASVALAMAMDALVEPAIGKIRNLIRGGRIEQVYAVPGDRR